MKSMGGSVMYEVARENEILKYLPLVERVVNRISIKSAEYDRGDLTNIGVIGLMDALNKYDPQKKVPFESYAMIRIKGAILDEVRKNAKISRYKMKTVNDFYKAKATLEQELKREATDLEICNIMQISEQQLGEIYDSIHYLASVSLEDTLFSNEQEGMTVQDTIQDQSMTNAEEAILQEEQQAILEKHVASLSEREQLILSLYYREELTLREIAEVLDISIARVSQLHGKIIGKLKERIQEEFI